MPTPILPLAHLAHPDLTVGCVAPMQHLELTLDQEEHLVAKVALAHHSLTRSAEERPHRTHDNVYEAEVGADLSAGDACGVIESVKTASDLYAPVSGEVTEINDALESEPGTVNEDPYGDGWFYRIRFSNADEIEDLLSPEDYAEQVNI